MKDTGALEGQQEPGWKLFGRVPHKELSTKDRKIPKVRYTPALAHKRPFKRNKNGVVEMIKKIAS